MPPAPPVHQPNSPNPHNFYTLHGWEVPLSLVRFFAVIGAVIVFGLAYAATFLFPGLQHDLVVLSNSRFAPKPQTSVIKDVIHMPQTSSADLCAMQSHRQSAERALSVLGEALQNDVWEDIARYFHLSTPIYGHAELDSAMREVQALTALFVLSRLTAISRRQSAYYEAVTELVAEKSFDITVAAFPAPGYREATHRHICVLHREHHRLVRLLRPHLLALYADAVALHGAVARVSNTLHDLLYEERYAVSSSADTFSLTSLHATYLLGTPHYDAVTHMVTALTAANDTLYGAAAQGLVDAVGAYVERFKELRVWEVAVLRGWRCDGWNGIFEDEVWGNDVERWVGGYGKVLQPSLLQLLRHSSLHAPFVMAFVHHLAGATGGSGLACLEEGV